MERQELQLNLKPMTVNQLVDLLRSRLESQVAQTEFSLNLQFDSVKADTHIAVDADAMMQVLMNLVDNSLKFSKDAGNKTIDFHIYQDQQSIIFDVRDYGPGIPPQEQPRVFDLFYRVGNELTRSAQGTGIGLALVHQLISEMGGSIRYFQPELGAGFRIRFPITPQ
jgi:Osmosensitive K+ channel histidine kinase